MRGITFGLTGKEFQYDFNTEKYIALAYQQPKGRLLQELVELNWDDWCYLVAEAPWRTYWKKSKYWKQQCVTPSDMLCCVSGCGSVPLAVYGAAVWGFGLEGWLKRAPGSAGSNSTRAPMYEVLRLQGVQNPRVVNNRTHMWDDKLYRGCGMLLPAEFGTLDRWLEPLWQQACKQCDHSSSK